MSSAVPRSERETPAAGAASTVSFYLNGTRREAALRDPCRTVLDFLRLEARLSGTKEGCGEGDCGACAAILCDRGADGAVRVRAANTCLLPLPALEGCYVFTVEGLAQAGTLHPVQERMVALHASQCGFCTPGFVAALAAFTEGDEPAGDAAIHDALAGNLCRCTGYRPIVEAARQAWQPGRDWWAKRLPEIGAALDRFAGRGIAFGGVYFAPRSADELASLIARMPAARLVAGATDLGLAIARHGLVPEALIAVTGVEELRRIEKTAQALHIGAAVTLTELLPLLDPHFPGLGTLLRRFGSRQIRNLATLGGNLCNASPIGDLAPVLLALDARLHLRSAQGMRDLAIADFFTGYRRTALAPGEFLQAVSIPLLAAGDRFRVYKLSKRYDQDISTVCAAIRLRIEGGTVREARIAMGGMAATPKRAPQAEAILAGAAFAHETIERAAAALAADYTPIGDLRGGAEFRRIAAANLLRRYWIETGGASAGAATEVMAL